MTAIDHDDTLDLDDEEWPVRARRGGIRMRVPTAILLALLIAAAGLWGGSMLQKRHGTTTAAAGSGSAASAFAAFRSRAGATGAGGFGGFGRSGAAAAGTFGTLTAVQGNIVYLTSSSGSLVKVKVSPATKITRNAKSAKGALKLGDTVIVSGKAAPNGTVTATSLSATAKGVTSGFSRFGGGGFGGAGGAGSGSGSGG